MELTKKFMKPNLNKLGGRNCFRFAVMLSGLTIALVARGQFDYAETSTYFGNWGQGNAGITVANALNIQPNACAPTAVLNGLIFLENYQLSLGNTDPFNANQNVVGNINTLARLMQTDNNNYANFVNVDGSGDEYTVQNPAAGAYVAGRNYRLNINGTIVTATYTRTSYNVGGTSEANLDSGLRRYLVPVNPNPLPFVYAYQSDDPSAGALGAVLKANDAVELGISWGQYNVNGQFVSTGGGHIVTLQSLEMFNGTKGIATLVDPWGTTTPAGGPAAAANDVSVSVTTVNGGLVINGIFGGDADLVGPLYGGPGTSLTAFVSFEEVESVNDKNGLPASLVFTPEPSTYLAGALVLIPFGVSCLRQWRGARRTA